MLHRYSPRLLLFLIATAFTAWGTSSVAAEPAASPAAPNPANLKILTWNVQMLPILAGIPDLDKGQAMRAPWIVEFLNRQDYDIVVLQEVIDRRMTTLLKQGLERQYPFIVAPASKWGIAGCSGGILFVSKTPLKYVAHIVYKHVAGVDALAEKGCLLVEGERGGVRFQIAGTHLQAGHNEMKEKEFAEIHEGILKPHQHQGVPQFLAGDLNVACDIADEKPRFELLLKTTEMRLFPLDDPEPYTVDGKNSWKGKSHEGERIDHILLNPRGTRTTIVRQTVQRARKEFEGKTIDLADHYGVVAEVLLQK
jgi:endonuclease/exonuclease/phosphatase family metal-dependent hydrolase